ADVGSVVFSLAKLKNNRIVCGLGIGTLVIWDLNSNKPVRTLKGHTNSARTVIELNDGRIGSGSDDGIRIWNASNGVCSEKLYDGDDMFGEVVYCIYS